MRQVDTTSEAALQVVQVHDARLFLHDCILRLLRSGQNVAASAALQSTATWHDEASILINCPPDQAKPLRQCWRFFSSRAHEEGLKAVFLGWKGCQAPYRFAAIAAEMALEENHEFPPLRSDKPELAALKIVEMMTESTLPMGLVDLDLDDQVWGNQALADIKNTTTAHLRRLNVRNLWSAADLGYVKDQLQQQSELIWRYQADLSPGDTRSFHSKFEVVIEERYRLTTLYEWEPLAVQV